MFTKEMQRALKADGEKLKALTGEDHGPSFDRYDTCPACHGFGNHEVVRPQHDDPYFTVLIECTDCNGSGWVLVD